MLGQHSLIQPIVQVDEPVATNHRIEKQILVLHFGNSLESHGKRPLPFERTLDVRAKFDLRKVARKRKYQRRVGGDDARQRIESPAKRFDDM